jgi:hypothetical protein
MADKAGGGEKMKEGTNNDGTGRRRGAGTLRREGVSAHEDGAEFTQKLEVSLHAMAFMEMCGGKAAGR